MKDMNINSVKLSNNGSKGLVVTYASPTNKNNISFLDEYSVKKKAPIHEDLENAFESLKPYLLEICDYPKVNLEKDLIETTITGVRYTNKGFIIIGHKCILESDKTICLKTPLITDGDYHDEDAVIKILDTIYTETKAYMSGAKTFSDIQLVMKFNSGKEGFDEGEFKKLSKEAQRDMATKILESQGAIVIHSDEIEAVEETKEESVLDGCEGVDGISDTTLGGTMEVEPVTELVTDDFDTMQPIKRPSPLQMIDREDGHFQIVANPIDRASTAKRKSA